MALPGIIAGVNLLSGLFGSKKKAKSQAEQLAYNRSLRLDPITGQFGQIGVEDGNVSAGIFGGLQEQFGGAAGNVLGNIDFSGGLPPEVAEALGLVQSRLQPGVNPMLGGLFGGQRQAQGVAGQAFGDIMGGDQFQPELMAQLFGGAGNLAGDLGSSFSGLRDSTLANLRARAAPENQRAVDTTFNRLFNQGRLGSTGGANILGRLAEAQNQQDLGFQLAAGDEARAASADTTNRFGALFGAGQGLQQTGMDRLQQAFGRFTGATGLGADLNSTAFGRMQGLESEGYNRLLDNFKSVAGLTTLPGQLQGQQIGLSQQLLGGATGIQDLLMQAFGGALSGATAKSNVRVAGAGLANSQQAAPGYSASPMQDAFQSLTSGLLSGGGFDLSKIFGAIGSRQPPVIGRGGSWG